MLTKLSTHHVLVYATHYETLCSTHCVWVHVLNMNVSEGSTHSSIISRTVVETVSRDASFQISSGFSWVPSKMCTAASALSRMASMKTPGRKRIRIRRTCAPRRQEGKETIQKQKGNFRYNYNQNKFCYWGPEANHVASDLAVFTQLYRTWSLV